MCVRNDADSGTSTLMSCFFCDVDAGPLRLGLSVDAVSYCCVVRCDCWLRPVHVSCATGVRVLFRCVTGIGYGQCQLMFGFDTDDVWLL